MSARRTLHFYLTRPGHPQLNLPAVKNIDAITQPKDGRCIKERINDSNLVSRDRDSVTPWETVRVSGDKGSTRDHVFCLLSQNQLGTLNRPSQLLSTEHLFCLHCYLVHLRSATVRL